MKTTTKISRCFEFVDSITLHHIRVGTVVFIGTNVILEMCCALVLCTMCQTLNPPNRFLTKWVEVSYTFGVPFKKHNGKNNVQFHLCMWNMWIFENECQLIIKNSKLASDFSNFCLQEVLHACMCVTFVETNPTM